ncbi:MAG: DNA polymerase III subunit beta [Candidatus Parabeggiatoa sp. nov. 3]|jgi:DNA polymerase-3 subunit beta|nr:MAG: DNA polymerase III subunit beta [Gammaproteobacteria bacterium]RKZ69672.1 MAG: DNA polymerase III subunit beta [Gammaproteobacteria bacterium]RKZ88087.1 MAG: DNA polymerase III subunit beta [Gammaproteobacteria bacterium]
MYFEISRKELLIPLKMITGVVEQRQTLPILANTLVSVKDNTLHLTATDAEVEIVCHLPLESGNLEDDNNGETTIPARKFFDICKSLSDEIVIQVKTEDNLATIKAGKSTFKLQTLPAEDFPETPKMTEQTEFNISQHNLKNLLYKTSFCVATNDVRYYLTGLLLEIGDGSISLVGTDGHRMAVAQHEFESDQTAKVIIPRKAVLELSKLLTDSDTEVKVLVDDNHIRFELSDAYVMSSKLIDGNFPDWHTVIPQNPDKMVIVETSLLKQSLTRASILSNEKYKGVRLQLSTNLLTISAKNAYQEEAEEIVEVEYAGSDELEIGFNGTYILDALNVISTKMVQLALSDSNSSCLITEENNEDNKFIVMPMRL